MTNIRDNEILTQVGPGTPMGELMRQYWIPAAMSSELKVDGDPLRLVLLGERLIAFRDSSGRVGIMDPRCPQSALAYEKDKTLPPSVDHPEYYDRVRGGHFVAKEGIPWLEAYRKLLAASPWEGVGTDAVG